MTLRTAGILPRRVVHTRDLLANLVGREFRSRYRDSALGVVWAVVSPLVQLSIYYFIFQQVLALGIRRYTSFVFIGLIAWVWFSSAVNASARILKSNRDIVEQPGFPAAVLPFVAATTSMIDFTIALPILAVIVALEGAPLNVTVLALPMVMAVQFAFILAVGLLIAAINAAFRDTQHIVVLGLQLYLFLSPIFYDLETVPESYRGYFAYNPLTHIVGGYREILMHGTVPSTLPLFVVAAGSGAAIVLGLRVYGWARYRYLEEL